MRIGEHETHPAADVFPLIEGEEYRALCKSIIERGLEKPIELWQGRVLDGRNRLRACIEVNSEPLFVESRVSDPYEYVWVHNAVRRHLDPGQRVAIRLKIDATIREATEEYQRKANEARSRAASKGRVGRASKKRPVQSCAPVPTTKPDGANHTKTELAKRADVSPRTAQKALTVSRAAPELFKKVAAGDLTLAAAYREVTKQPPPAPPGVARIAKLMSELDRGASNLQVRISEVVRILETKDDLQLVGAGAWSVVQRLDLLADQIGAFTAGMRTRGNEATA